VENAYSNNFNVKFVALIKKPKEKSDRLAVSVHHLTLNETV
jgi:hypothetical protein